MLRVISMLRFYLGDRMRYYLHYKTFAIRYQKALQARFVWHSLRCSIIALRLALVVENRGWAVLQFVSIQEMMSISPKVTRLLAKRPLGVANANVSGSTMLMLMGKRSAARDVVCVMGTKNGSEIITLLRSAILFPSVLRFLQSVGHCF